MDVSFNSTIDGIRLFLGALESEKKEISTRILDLNGKLIDQTCRQLIMYLVVSATEALSDVLDIIALERDNLSIEGSHALISSNDSSLSDDQMLLTQ